LKDWVKANPEKAEQEIAYEDWINSLDEEYLNSMEKDDQYWRDKEEQEASTGEDLIKMKDSI
jgi:hypothetical protein